MADRSAKKKSINANITVTLDWIQEHGGIDGEGHRWFLAHFGQSANCRDLLEALADVPARDRIRWDWPRYLISRVCYMFKLDVIHECTAMPPDDTHRICRGRDGAIELEGNRCERCADLPVRIDYCPWCGTAIGGHGVRRSPMHERRTDHG